MATSIPGDAYDLTTFSNLFKRVFRDEDAKFQDIGLYLNPLLKRIQIEEGFVGTDFEVMRSTSLMGGYGYGATMPRVNESALIRPRLLAKKYYTRSLLDTESMAASMASPGAFRKLVEKVREDLTRADEQGLALALWHGIGNGDLQLGTIATSGVSGSDPYVLTLTVAPGHRFHVKQLLNVGTGDTDVFEVTLVDEANLQITVDRLTGSQTPADADEIYLQGSEGNAFTGLIGAAAQSGTLYNVTINESNRWIMRLVTKTGESPDEHLLYNEIVEVFDKCGEYPDMIATSKVQFLKIQEFLADKRILNDSSDFMGHGALSIMGPNGKVAIFWDRLCLPGDIWFLNSKRITLHKRPMSGLITDPNGSVLMPNYIVDTDSFLVQRRLYGNYFIEPAFHGRVTGLATS